MSWGNAVHLWKCLEELRGLVGVLRTHAREKESSARSSIQTKTPWERHGREGRSHACSDSVLWSTQDTGWRGKREIRRHCSNLHRTMHQRVNAINLERRAGEGKCLAVGIRDAIGLTGETVRPGEAAAEKRNWGEWTDFIYSDQFHVDHQNLMMKLTSVACEARSPPISIAAHSYAMIN
jgi:hypothetical protein